MYMPLTKSAISKRNQWLEEVAAVKRANPKLSHAEALKQASAARKQAIPGYKTVKQRVVQARKPRQYYKADGSVGKFRPAGPYQKRSKQLMTVDAAKNALRAFYRQKIGLKTSNKQATTAMRRDISSKTKSTRVLTPCPTKTITYSRRNPKTGKLVRVTRKVAVRTEACKRSWLYRKNPHKDDMQGVDNGLGRASPAYRPL